MARGYDARQQFEEQLWRDEAWAIRRDLQHLAWDAKERHITQDELETLVDRLFTLTDRPPRLHSLGMRSRIP